MEFRELRIDEIFDGVLPRLIGNALAVFLQQFITLIESACSPILADLQPRRPKISHNGFLTPYNH
jgi:hypothetical protein